MMRRASLAAVATTVLFAAHADAANLYFSHPYGEFIDRGDIIAKIWPDDELGLECPTSVSYAQTGNKITLTTRKAPPGQVDMGLPCRYVASVVLGPMAVGTYEVTARIRSVDGLSYESTTQILEVIPTDGRCNPDPALLPSIMAIPADQSAAEFVMRVKSDPVFAASIGNPAVRVFDYAHWEDPVAFEYPPLEDIAPAMDRLVKAAPMKEMWRNGRACLSPPVDQAMQFVEFYHGNLDHYFYSGDASEIAAIDAGTVGAGWARTGKFFRAATMPNCDASEWRSPVYRFFGVPGVGPNSHFFTRNRAECSIVNKSAKWSFEGVPFWAGGPGADGICPEGQVALYRAWRPFGDSNHRFSTDRQIIAAMVAQGWVDEGVAMCVLPPE